MARQASNRTDRDVFALLITNKDYKSPQLIPKVKISFVTEIFLLQREFQCVSMFSLKYKIIWVISTAYFIIIIFMKYLLICSEQCSLQDHNSLQ